MGWIRLQKKKLKWIVSNRYRGWNVTAQVCSNGTRVFVHKDIWEKFVSSLVARTKAMKIGDPLDEETTVGATISKEHAEKVLSYIDRAKQAVKVYWLQSFLGPNLQKNISRFVIRLSYVVVRLTCDSDLRCGKISLWLVADRKIFTIFFSNFRYDNRKMFSKLDLYHKNVT